MKKIPRGIIMPRALMGYVSSFFLQGAKLLLNQGDKKETFCILRILNNWKLSISVTHLVPPLTGGKVLSWRDKCLNNKVIVY